MVTKIEQISDDRIQEEYVKRFSLVSGAKLNSSNSSIDHLRSFFADLSRDQEHFVVVFLDGQNQIIKTECVFTGSLTSSAVYPRELVKKVLKYESAAVICAHSHPSGSLRPSTSDRQVTKKLQNALGSIDVELLDHIILGGTDSYSFSDGGLL